MAQITLYAQSNAAWDAANQWGTTTTGGTLYTNPQNGADTYICDLNAKNVTVAIDVTVDLIRTGVTNAGGTIVLGANSKVITASITSSYAGTMLTWGAYTSLTITGTVTYSSTSTSGMLTVGTGQTLVINGLTTTSSSGYAILTSGTGVLTCNNVGTDVLSQQSSGRTISAGSSGNLTINGNITMTGNGYAIYQNGSTLVVNGDVYTNSSGVTGFVIRCANGSTTINGGIYSSVRDGRYLIYINAGYLYWSGVRTLTADQSCMIAHAGAGVITFSNLTLYNYGKIYIVSWSTISTDIVMTNGRIINMTATAQTTLNSIQTFTLIPYSQPYAF